MLGYSTACSRHTAKNKLEKKKHVYRLKVQTNIQRHLDSVSDHVYEQSRWDVAAIPQARSTAEERT